MTHDEAMAAQVRDAVPAGTTEKRMFGALAFLVDDHLALTVGADELMIRIGADAIDAALALPGVSPCVMGQRTMKDWVLVAFSAVADDPALTMWVDRGVDFVRSLPAK